MLLLRIFFDGFKREKTIVVISGSKVSRYVLGFFYLRIFRMGVGISLLYHEYLWFWLHCVIYAFLG